MTTKLLQGLGLLLVAAACSSPPTSEQFVSSAAIIPTARGARSQAECVAAAQNDHQNLFGGLATASAELGLLTQDFVPGVVNSNRRAVLPPSMLGSAFLKKLVKVELAAANVSASDGFRGGAVSDTSVVSFSHGDVEAFTKDVFKVVGLPTDARDVQTWMANAQSIAPAGNNSSFWAIAQKYLVAYFAGKFVDRGGSKLTRPEVKSTVGNETITGTLTVVLEALHDSFFRMPVFYENKNGKEVPLNKSGLWPTAYVLKECGKEEVGDNLAITPTEAQAIAFLGDVAGEQSRALSGLFIRLFSNASISFVIGGAFALGDNDTLAAVSDTIFECASRRTTQAILYNEFRMKEGEQGFLKEFLAILKRILEELAKSPG